MSIDRRQEEPNRQLRDYATGIGIVVGVGTGLLLHTFVFDRVGLWLMQRGGLLALFAWSNLCFVNGISFFTPKFNTFPVWLFTVCGVVGAFQWRRRGIAATEAERTNPADLQ